MTPLKPLLDVEKTVSEIIIELLLQEREGRYPDLIRGDPERKESVRITMHYLMALLAYGFGVDEPEITSICDWFDRPFPIPQKRHNYIDVNEMNRLMVLLRIRPHGPGAQRRLEQLIQQRGARYFDIQSGWQDFDTLWTLEALTLAHQQDALPGHIATLDQLRDSLNTLIVHGGLFRDKDFALALRLQYTLFGELTSEQHAELDELIRMEAKNQGMWGLREFGWMKDDMLWYSGYVQKRTLTYEDVHNHRLHFRKVILSTCMVIENLLPLAGAYPELCAPIERAMDNLWAQIKGADAPTVLRTLFPHPADYNYLLVLARVLRALVAYTQQPPLHPDKLYLLRSLASSRANLSEAPERRAIRQALRTWIQVDLLGNVEQLKLGFSEAQIVRVHPQVSSPLADEDETSTSIINHSLIIKYGPTSLIENERRHFESLPGTIRDCFVRIPRESYTDPATGQAYVIMQDLRGYRTLYELHEAIALHVADVAEPLGAFLMRVHEGDGTPMKPAAQSLIRDIYLNKMMENVDRIFDFLLADGLLPNHNGLDDLRYALFRCIGDVLTGQRSFDGFPGAYMHGDLHLRNIMVRGLDNDKHSGLSFKLIDLEYLRPGGDAAFDAGQLLIDIDLVNEEERGHDENQALLDLKKRLEQRYTDFAWRHDDHNFQTRLKLAKARALMRIGKGKAKRGTKYVGTAQQDLAVNLAEDVAQLAARARDYLTGVVDELP